MDRQPSLRATAVSGAIWTGGSSLAMVGLHIVQLVVLARLLGPREFGVAAMVLVVVRFAMTVTDLGISNALIARPTDDRGRLSSLFWANVVAGLGVSLLMVAVVPLIVAYFDEPRLTGLVLLAALAPVIAALGQQFQSLLQRDLEFKALARIEIVAAVSGPAAAVAAAVAGLGAAAIVIGLLATTAAKSALLIAQGWRRWRPAVRFRRADLDGYIGFGMYQLGDRFATYAGTNIDYILIGGFLGPTALGVYTIAFTLVSLPYQRLNPVFMRVAFPIFARRQSESAALRRGYMEVTRLIATATFPLMVGLAIVAPHFVPVVYGERFEDAIPILQIETLLGAMFALANPQGAMLLAKDRPDLGFKLNLGRVAVLAAGLWVAVQYGLVEVAGAYVAIAAMVFVTGCLLLQRLIGLRLARYFAALGKPAALAAAMGVVVLAASLALSAAEASDHVALIIEVAVGAATYLALLVALDRAYLRSLWRSLASARGGVRTSRAGADPTPAAAS